jgi:hypothetical protein
MPTEFSTSGCKIMLGTKPSSVSGSLPFDLETILKTCLFDIEIVLEKLEFFLERHFLETSGLESHSQKIA